MPEPRPSGEAFAVDQLRSDPHLDYPTVRDLAARAGVSLQPIQYGRARRQLGLPALRDAHHGDAHHDGTPTQPPREASMSSPSTDGVEREVAAAKPRPTRGGSPAFEFLVQQLRADPTLVYATLRDRATDLGHKVAPIMYGRAKALLGLVPVKPRGSKKARKQAPSSEAAPPLRLRQVDSVAADRVARRPDDGHSLDQLVDLVRDLDAERRRLRDVLERVVAMIDEALG
ncbi:MAG TPA: hypothetical protein VFZ65_15155 [Planctomycetota bacterium]|nr:hypothetical protein [Planctomycetota bacterium]